MYSPLDSFTPMAHGLVSQPVLTYLLTLGAALCLGVSPQLRALWGAFFQFILTLSPMKAHLPLTASLFLLIGLGDLGGLFPYTFSFTAQFSVGLALSATVWLGVLFTALQAQAWGFLAHFLPAGIPFGLAPLLIPIEGLSYLARALSLGVRLSANLISGHLLILVLLGFAKSLGGATPALLALVAALTVLELAVCLIQAYVFTILTGIYLGEAS